MATSENILSNEVKKAILAVTIGNSLELYDFSLYGYFAAIFATHFFSCDNYLYGLLMTYGLFAGSFLLRPLGGVFFGYIGDGYGRKKALEISVLMMAVPTVIIGILPTYLTIGIMAPIGLSVLRMIQSLSVGGELAGSYSFLVEHAPPARKGFVGSWTLVGNFGGKLLATLAVGLMTILLTKDQLENWGWRIPFLFGMVIAFTGYFLRKNIKETPVFLEMKHRQSIQKAPITEVLKSCKASVAHAAAILIIHTVALYLFFVYLPIYLKVEINLPYERAVLSNFIALLLVIVVAPISALISDKIGRKTVLLAGSLALTLFTYPAFYLISSGSYPIIVTVHSALAILFAAAHGPIPAFYSEFFSPEVRYTALAVSYNLCVGIFGGATPLIATTLIAMLGSPLAPTYWLIACGTVSCVAVACLKETSETNLLKKELQHA